MEQDKTRTSIETARTGARKEMTSFWEGFSSSTTIAEMLLENNPEELSAQEMPEIVSYLPDTSGKRILELGAGIGRFTSVLAEGASSLIAVDFMKTFIDANREKNGHHGNVQFRCSDATSLEQEHGSIDLAFSNWLLMYLEDEEVEKLLENILLWLDEDGCVFVRESVEVPPDISDPFIHGDNPTRYRRPDMYETFFRNCSSKDDAGEIYGFELVRVHKVDAYIKLRKRNDQIVWLWRKVKKN